MREQTIETQAEFVKWLKEHKMYNEWIPENMMQAMYEVWEECIYPEK